jgi:membrane-associated protease RseP (regulator of RpoE activity)
MSRTALRSSLPVLLLLLFGGAAVAGAQPLDWATDLPFGHPRARIGVQVQAMTPELREHLKAPEDRGLLVGRVEPDRPAARGGLRVGDVIVSAGGKPMRRPFDLVRVVGRAAADQPLELQIVRDGKERTLTVKPEAESTPWADPDRWAEWMERGMHQGSKELRRRLQMLERRLEELERRFELERGPLGDGERRT